MADLLQRIAGPLADEVGNSFAISYRSYRVKLGLKALQKTQRMLKEAGISPQAVPPRLFLPMVEAASIEDDEDWHTRWAALLANPAASPDLVHPSFIEVLKQLTPVEARLLDALFKIAGGKQWQKVETTAVTGEEFKAAGPRLFTLFSNFIRLGLIQISFDIERKSREIKVKVPNIGMSKWPGLNVEGYFDGELEET